MPSVRLQRDVQLAPAVKGMLKSNCSSAAITNSPDSEIAIGPMSRLGVPELSINVAVPSVGVAALTPLYSRMQTGLSWAAISTLKPTVSGPLELAITYQSEMPLATFLTQIFGMTLPSPTPLISLL